MLCRSTPALVALLPAVAGCGARASESAPETPPSALVGRTLDRNGVSISVLDGWDGRILFREPTGTSGVVFQLANFALPTQAGLEPPPPGPDPIKAMDGGDVLITILTDAPAGRPIRAPLRLDALAFLPGASPRVPHGHALAEGSVCLEAHCLEVAADFGEAPPDRRLVEQVDEILASVAVGGRDAIELDGLRLDVPQGWHGYAATLGADASQPVIWVANVRFAEATPRPDFPSETLRTLSSTGVVVEAIAAASSGPRTSAPFTDGEVGQIELPLTLEDGTFLARDYEGQQARHGLDSDDRGPGRAAHGLRAGLLRAERADQRDARGSRRRPCDRLAVAARRPALDKLAARHVARH